MIKKIPIFSCFALLSATPISPYGIAQSAENHFWTTEDLREVENGQFRCPETLSTLAEKAQEMERFLAWTQARHPNWTVEQIVAFRMATLKHYACTKTLNNIREAAD